jgi:hypothetical protein
MQMGILRWLDIIEFGCPPMYGLMTLLFVMLRHSLARYWASGAGAFDQLELRAERCCVAASVAH